jgi:protein TonB
MKQTTTESPAKGFRARLAGISLLQWALTASFILHAILLATHFSFPDYSKTMRDKALDIILVNSRSATRPTDAQALAQSNLDGGGNTDEERRAKTPLPPTLHQSAGAEIEQMKRRVQELESRQQAMLTQAKSKQRIASAEQRNEQPKPSPQLNGYDLAESARAMARLEGEISKSLDEYSKRPRKKFIGARTEEHGLAIYLDSWKQKIERVGTLNYPEAARGKLYGSLIITVAIKADGQVERIEINRSSGHKVLDDAARRIVQLASPYAAFPPDIRRDTDIIEITRTWSFTQGDHVSAK